VNARGLLLAVLCSACVPVPHDLEGRSCAADGECVNTVRSDLVCYRAVCTRRGTFGTTALPLEAASSEGGVDGTARAPVRPSLTAFTASAPLAAARAGAAAAGGFLVGGTGTAEVLGPNGATTPLPAPRSQAAAAFAGGRLFVIGGLDEAGSPVTEVRSAPLTGSGLGEWEGEPALVAPRAGAQAIAAGGFVYLLGGESAAGLTDEVIAAPLGGDGRLGPWRRAGQLPAPRTRAGAAVFDGRVWVAGGSCAGACPPLSAALLRDGGVDVFTALPALLPERVSPAVIVAGGALHVIGGRLGAGQVLSDVATLPLGAEAQWQQQPRLPRAVYEAAARESRGTVTISGGRGADGGVLADQLAATVTTAGAEAFRAGPDVPEESENGALTTWNGALYTVGGSRNAGLLDTIFRAEPAAGAGLTPWRRAGTLPVPSSELGAAAWGGRLYLLGGCRNFGGNCLSTPEQYSAPLLPDGGVGPARMEPALPGGDEIAGMEVAAVNGALYCAGGVTGYNPTRREVWRSTIDPSSGALSPPVPAAPLSADAGLWGHALVQWRGHLFAVGGQSNGGFGDYSDRVLHAALAPDGTVSPWALAGRLPQQRGRVSAVVFDDTLYVVNGCNETGGASFCSNYPAALLAAPLHSDGGVGAFAALLNHPSAARGAQAAVLGGQLVTVAGYDGNQQTWTYLSELHGRGRLGPAHPAQTLPVGTTAQAAAGENIYAFGAGGAVSGPAQVAALPEAAQAAGATAGALYAVSGQRVWRGALPLTEWAELPQLPRALTAPVMAGSFVAEGRAVFAYVEGSWAEWTAPVAVERLALSSGWLYALGGADVFVTGTQAEQWRRVEGLPGPRPGFGAAASDSMLYVAGGGGLQDVLVSAIGGDGTLGPWSSAATLPAAWPAVELLAAAGELIAYGGSAATAWPRHTPPERGTFSLRVDLGGDVTAVEGLTLEGEGEWSAEVRLAGEDGAFGGWVPLGFGRSGEELRVGRPGRYLWLRVTLQGDSRVTGGAVATKL